MEKIKDPINIVSPFPQAMWGVITNSATRLFKTFTPIESKCRARKKPLNINIIDLRAVFWHLLCRFYIKRYLMSVLRGAGKDALTDFLQMEELVRDFVGSRCGSPGAYVYSTRG